jgi:hypothetical protein
MLNLIVGIAAAISAVCTANTVATDGHRNSHGPSGCGAGNPCGRPEFAKNASNSSQSRTTMEGYLAGRKRFRRP